MATIKYRAHRGNAFCAPENTMPAFESAWREGFDTIETDPCFTKDRQIVLLHDNSLNRTCRNADGTPIQEPLLIRDLTYDEILAYDAGIACGEAFRGTRVPRLQELLAWAQDKDIILELDKKIATEEMDPLLELVAGYNANVAFYAADMQRVQKILSRLPHAMINYDGETDDASLREVCHTVPAEQLLITVYCCDWVSESRRATIENCMRIKKYTHLGIGLTDHPYRVYWAQRLGADLIEI